MIAAADDPAQDEPIRESHREGQRVGAETGSPITAYDDGPAFVGPVVSPAPTGTAALDHWYALTVIARVPQFSELKRSRQPLPSPEI